MRRSWVYVAVLVGLLGFAVPGQAQVFIRAPFVRVAVGQPLYPGGPAGVYVRAPFVQVGTPPFPPPIYVGPLAPPALIAPPPVIVGSAPSAPPENLTPPTPLPQQSPPPQPAPAEQQPQATVAPPAPAAVTPNRPMTVDEFAKTFQPVAGKYQVTLLHPRTNSPVTVAFTLPEGTPRVRLTHRELSFDYGRQEVEIRFLLGGRVEVSYLD